MLAERWKNQEVPEFDGIVCASGERYVFEETSLVRSAEAPAAVRWIDVAILAAKDLHGGQYRVVCGESAAHGSIGVVVLEDAQSGGPLWSFVSSWSNPFDQIELKAGY